MGIKMNRQIVYGNVKYNMFCNHPCYDISTYGYEYLLSKGFHPDTNPWILDEWEEYLLRNGFLKCVSIPTSESQLDQLNLEVLHMSILG